ncbi:MAG: adenylosuccinate synthase [Kiritimatiellia bacterium]
MPNTVLIGAQWGDEGKGKIIDVLAGQVDIVVRYQGGNNAGHTVKIGDEHYVLHLIPSGILRDDQVCVIGNGLVVNPGALLDEVAEVETAGKNVQGRLFVSDRAHIVFPYHRAIDAAREASLAEGSKIGTTGRGIGPCYSDKVTRTGLRAGDLLAPDFPELLKSRLYEANKMLTAMGGEALPEEGLLRDSLAIAERMRPYIKDTVTYLNDAIKQGQSVLFEGAQGTMLDIDFGTYPFVTSSNATAGGACTGSGVPPHRIDRVVGVIKTYTTRVGEGPFPTELFDADGQRMRDVGGEYGATTGRPRRCGWFDAVVGRYSARINGVDFWAMTKLDVLDGFETLRICTAYEYEGALLREMPASFRILEKCKPVYEEMPGWCEPTSHITEYAALPERARAYVEYLCALTGVPLGILSVGPKRESTLRLGL